MTDELSSRYLLLKPLGEGPTGVTWRARALATGEDVAVKALHESIAALPAPAARFQAEKPVLTAHFDKRVLRVREIVQGTGTIALVSEFVEGESLASLLARSGRLPHDHAMWAAAQLAAALAALHAANVVHCDITPANILIAADGTALRVADLRTARAAFGFAGDVAAFGTDGYASPDRSAKAATAPGADVYSFGTLIAESLSGRRPRPDDPLPDIPTRVRGLLAACLAREPGDRPAAAEIVAALGDPPPSPGPLPDRRRVRARTARPSQQATADSPAAAGRPAPTRLRRLAPQVALALLGTGFIGAAGAVWLPAIDRGPASASETAGASAAATPPDGPQAAPTAANSVEFARHWFTALDFAVRTGDVSALRAASADSCGTCTEAIDTVQRAFANGGALIGGGYEVRTVTATGFWSLEHPTLDVVFDRVPRTSRAGTGQDPPAALPGAVFATCQVTLAWKGDRWSVTTVLAGEAIA